MKNISWAAFIIGLIVLSLGWLYCFQNSTGHSSLDPLLGSILFIPFLLLGIFHIALSKCRAIAAWFLSVIGISGAGFGIFIHKTAVMQEYGYWAHSGLNAPNPHSKLLLVGYGVGVVLMLGVPLIISVIQRKAIRPQRRRWT